MGMPAIRLNRLVRHTALRGALVLAGFGQVLLVDTALAQGQSTPIQSPQDATCRNEARARVFTAPDPQGLGLYAVGRQIYMECMKRANGAPRRRGSHSRGE